MAIVRGHRGSREPAAYACTRSSSTPSTRTGWWLPSLPPAFSAAMTGARTGVRRTGACARKGTSLKPRPKLGTASIMSPCTRRDPMYLFMQKHWDVMRSDDGGNSWQDVGEGLPSDFGFCIDVHAHEPDTIFRRAHKERFGALPARRQTARVPEPRRGREWEPMTKGLPQQNCYVNVYRDAMSVDSLEPCGVYFGTTGGQVYASADGGESWDAPVRDLPPVLSVEAQTLS